MKKDYYKYEDIIMGNRKNCRQIIEYKYDSLIIVCKTIEDISLQIKRNNYTDRNKVLIYNEFESIYWRE